MAPLKLTNCGYNNRGHVVLREGQNFAAEVRSQHADLFMAAADVQAALKTVAVKITDGMRRCVNHGGEVGVYLTAEEIDQVRAALAKANPK